MRIAKQDLRFVNVYHIDKYSNQGNSISVIGCYEATNYKKAKEALSQINSAYQDPNYSVVLENFNAFK